MAIFESYHSKNIIVVSVEGQIICASEAIRFMSRIYYDFIIPTKSMQFIIYLPDFKKIRRRGRTAKTYDTLVLLCIGIFCRTNLVLGKSFLLVHIYCDLEIQRVL